VIHSEGDLMQEIQSNTSTSGLSSQEAFERLKQFGLNELPTQKARTAIHLLAEILKEPMVYLLLIGGGVYLILGDRQEALSLIGFLILIVLITLYQERKTERALESLRDLSSPCAWVVRDGKRIRIPGIEIVRGDLLVVSEGDRVAADAELFSAIDLQADESLLTGESIPVIKRKKSDEENSESLLKDFQVYAGSTIVRGHGFARVFATGIKTELGKIGKSLEKEVPEISYLQRETRKLVRLLAVIATLLCVGATVVFVWTRHDLLGGILAGLTLAMAILPNELPAVLLIFLATGAWRLSQRQVLARRIPAVEMLGSATVLCVDKTGTLTLNRMTIQSLWRNGVIYEVLPNTQYILPEEVHELVEYGILASRPEPFDPMERAFHAAGREHLSGTEHLHSDWTLLREYSISDSLLAVSYAWKARQENGWVISAKGAPEAVIDLCHLSSEKAEPIRQAVVKLASDGLRVLGVARAHAETRLPPGQHDFDFEFLGLIGLADPVRPDVSQAIRECQAAGIRVIMITGDHPETASSIAKKIGFLSPEKVLTGMEVNQLTDEELKARLNTVSVFSRMIPEQKLRLVKVLKSMGEVVGMTGDGVNDAPALKAADIGIAMGQRGTDVAREAAALVLLQDDFSSIVTAVRMGRRIFLNLRHAFAYLLAIHVPITLVSIIPIIFKLPLVLFPVHIAFLHLIIEPACTFVFERESESSQVMKEPPRKPDEPLFRWKMVQSSLLQGLWVSVAVLGVFLISLWRGQGEEEARALIFTTLIIANLGLIFNQRTETGMLLGAQLRPNCVFRLIVFGSFLFMGAILYVPWLRSLFRFSFCSGPQLARQFVS